MTSPLALVRIEHLYPLLALSFFGFVISLTPIPPNDFWWHVKAGEIVAEEGRIPDTNLWAWTLPRDQPFVYGGWLGQLLLYLSFSAGGVPLVVFLRNALALTMLALVAWEARRRSGSWRLATLATTLAGFMALGNVTVRPQMWAWLPFMLMLLILARYSAGVLRPTWLLALPILMALWVNLHGSFVLGIGLVGAYLAGELLPRVVDGAEALEWGRIRSLALAALATLLATLANPFGLGIFRHAEMLLTDEPGRKLGLEWQPPAPTDLGNGTFYASILLLIVVLAATRKRPSASDLLVLCSLLWLAWSGQRYVIWFGLMAAPVIIGCLSGIPIQLPLRPGPGANASAPASLSSWGHRSNGVTAGGVPALNASLAALLLVPIAISQPWFVREAPIPDVYHSRMLSAPAPPMLSTDTPIGAAEHIKRNPGGRLFNDLGDSSYLIWAVPEQGVFIDTRFAPYSLKIFEDHLAITEARRWEELLNQYGADRILLSLRHQPRLAEALTGSRNWTREYADPRNEVWTRADARR